MYYKYILKYARTFQRFYKLPKLQIICKFIKSGLEMKEFKLEFIKVDNVLRHIVSMCHIEHLFPILWLHIYHVVIFQGIVLLFYNIGPWGSTLMALTWKYKEGLYLVKEIIPMLKFAAYFIS